MTLAHATLLDALTQWAPVALATVLGVKAWMNGRERDRVKARVQQLVANGHGERATDPDNGSDTP